MHPLHPKLLAYAYNITGSYEDARDLVQDVLEKYNGLDKSRIDNETNYLVRSVINHALNFKKKHRRVVRYGTWLPEPLATDTADGRLLAEDTASFSMLVLMEKLSPKERAVFVLKEGFDYSHDEIAAVLSTTTDNSRKLLSRARARLGDRDFTHRPVPGSLETIAAFVAAIQQGDVKTLEDLLCSDISLAADGGSRVQVAASITTGVPQAVQLLTYVYKAYLKGLASRFLTVNNQPALLYYTPQRLVSCLVFELEGPRVHRLYSVVDPQKLQHLLEIPGNGVTF